MCGSLTHKSLPATQRLDGDLASHFSFQRDSTQRPLGSRQIVARAVLGVPSIKTLRS
jgi:hypothetical protein